MTVNIPAPLYHHYIFPPGGNMAGGNLMVGHDNSDEDSEYSGDGYDDHGEVALLMMMLIMFLIENF